MHSLVTALSRVRLGKAFFPNPWHVLIAMMLLTGGWLRVKNFAEPSSFLFDEGHFVRCARQYMIHQSDWNDHPPLGKLIIAFTMGLTGDCPFGWRISSLFFGVLAIVSAGIASARLFKNSLAGWWAAAFLSLDGLMITYSRSAHLDIYLAAAATLLIVSMRPTYKSALFGGIVWGFAVSIKFSGLGLLLPFAVYLLLTKIPRKQLGGMFGIYMVSSAAVYVAQYLVGLYLSGQPASVGAVVAASKHLVAMHVGAAEWTNPWTSDWFTWAIPVRAIPFMFTRTLGEIRVVSGLSNPIVSWAGGLLFLACAIAVLVKGVAATAAPTIDDTVTNETSPSFAAFVRIHGHAVLLLLSGCAGFLAPWIFSHRDSYLYHFIPVYFFIIVLLGGFCGWLQEKRPMYVLAFAVLILIVAAYLSPIWTFTPISQSELGARLFWSGWR